MRAKLKKLTGVLIFFGKLIVWWFVSLNLSHGEKYDVFREQQASVEAYKASVAAAASAKATEAEALTSATKIAHEDDTSDSEAEEVAYMCELCDKSFKNENSFLNHQTSKLHLKMVEKYSAELEEISESEIDDDDENDVTETDGVNNTSTEKENGANSNQSESSCDENEFDPNELKCLFCNKDFKTMNAKESHERSKKHRDIVKKAKIEMEKELKVAKSSTVKTCANSDRPIKQTETLDENEDHGDSPNDDEFLHR